MGLVDIVSHFPATVESSGPVVEVMLHFEHYELWSGDTVCDNSVHITQSGADGRQTL